MPLIPVNGENDRFHSRKSDTPEKSFELALKAGEINQRDKELILEYVYERTITNGIKAKRVHKIVSSLISCRRFLGPYAENTYLDIYQGISRIQSGGPRTGGEYAQNTRGDLILILKAFTLWMIENGYLQNVPEKKIQAIKVPKKVATKDAADILSVQEVEAMLAACTYTRNRAILMMLYEGGFRAGEIGQMKWRDIQVDNAGLIVHVIFKTDKHRYVRLVLAREHVITWRSEYPLEYSDENYVFVTEKGTPLSYATIAKLVNRTAKLAKITKHITPHIFRHSRITHLLQQGVNESVVKMMMWGTIESRMFINYAHLTGSDVDREMFKLYGMETSPQASIEKLEPKICAYCKEINSPVSHHCHICGHALSENAIHSSEAFHQFILNNSDLLVEYLQERKANGGDQPIVEPL
ncbi:MAG: phage integrase family protein [Methanomicrobiales archaeon]|nr:phage integrase family protein [Methanomicrobiales archaeon]